MSAVTFAAAADRGVLRRPLLADARSARGNLATQTRSSVARNARGAASASGLLELSEGEWEAAEKTLTRYARDAENPVAHYLVAARAADLQGAAQRRDEWLARALEASTDRRAPVLIMQAEMHLKHKQLAVGAGDAGTTGSERRIECARRCCCSRGSSSDGRLAAAAGTRAALAQHARHPACARRRNRRADLSGPAQGGRRRGRSRAAGVGVEGACRSRWHAAPDIVVAYARAAMACDDHEAAEAELREVLERALGRSSRAHLRRARDGRAVRSAGTRRILAAGASARMRHCC